MSNPVYDALVGVQQNDPRNIVQQQFQRFRKKMQGKNPTEEINKLLRSGKISQHHLDRAQQMANQMQSIFKGPII